jgi:hypothetical protein
MPSAAVIAHSDFSQPSGGGALVIRYEALRPRFREVPAALPRVSRWRAAT